MFLKKPAEQLLLTRLTNDSGFTTDPAISPDGKLVAYASDRSGEGNLDIWVQNIGTGDRVRLAPNPADDYQPSFSPDGSKVVFRSDRDGGGIYTAAVLGGDLKLIAQKGTRSEILSGWPEDRVLGWRIVLRSHAGVCRAGQGRHSESGSAGILRRSRCGVVA